MGFSPLECVRGGFGGVVPSKGGLQDRGGGRGQGRVGGGM